MTTEPPVEAGLSVTWYDVANVAVRSTPPGNTVRACALIPPLLQFWKVYRIPAEGDCGVGTSMLCADPGLTTLL